MEVLYGIRFNGHKIAIYKYNVIMTYENNFMELENITPGINRLATHIYPRVHTSRIGKLLEQDNSYIIYIETLDSLNDAVQAITNRVERDKAIYLDAVKARVAEFDAQLKDITTTDFTSIIQRLMPNARPRVAKPITTANS